MQIRSRAFADWIFWRFGACLLDCPLRWRRRRKSSRQAPCGGVSIQGFWSARECVRWSFGCLVLSVIATVLLQWKCGDLELGGWKVQLVVLVESRVERARVGVLSSWVL